MAKKKKKGFQYKDISFDSNQQIFFYKWLQQAQQFGLVQEFEYQPESFMLSFPVRINGKHALREHKYTADYRIVLAEDKLPKVAKIFKYGESQVWVDVKGGFNLYNNHTEFSVNRKWVFQATGIFVYKIEVDSLFEKTYVPKGCRYTQKLHKLREKYKDHKTVEQFMQGK